MKKQYENIFCIVNEGFEDSVMEAAWGEGATGGTVLSARGTGSKNAEKDFGNSTDGWGSVSGSADDEEDCGW